MVRELRKLKRDIEHALECVGDLELEFHASPLVRSHRIITNLRESLQTANEWVFFNLKHDPSSTGLASTSASTAPNEDRIGNSDLPFSALDQGVERYWLDIASKLIAAAKYEQAETAVQRVLNVSGISSDLHSEGRDEAMVMLATVYCKQNKFEAADRIVRENNFHGKDKAMELLTGTYCRRNMWEEAGRLVTDDFEGRDTILKALAEEFYSQGKLNEAEKVIRFEFNGKDSILELLGFAYCEKRMWKEAESLLKAEFEGRGRVVEKLAAGYCRYGQAASAEHLVLELLKDRQYIGIDTLETVYKLATGYFDQGDLNTAENYCLDAINAINAIKDTSPEGRQHRRLIALLLRIYETQGMQDKVERYEVLLGNGNQSTAQWLISEYREIKRLSNLEPETAAVHLSSILSDVVLNLTADESEDIIANVKNSTNGTIVCEKGFSLLHAFARLGNDEVVELLLEKGANAENKDTRSGCTPLMYAIRGGQMYTVKLLLDRGSDIESRMRDGSTALVCAVQCGQTEIVELLLARGAGIETKDNEGSTPLICAAYRGHKDITNLLLANEAKVDAKSKHGYTALMVAAREGHVNLVSVLLDQGAKLEAQDHLNNTALIRAAWKGHESVVRLLLDRGADPGVESLMRKYTVWRRMKAIDFVPKEKGTIKDLLKEAAARKKQRPDGNIH